MPKIRVLATNNRFRKGELVQSKLREIIYRGVETYLGQPGERPGSDADELVKKHFSGYWDDQAIYPLAWLYLLERDDNPWFNNPLLLNCARGIAENIFASDKIERRAIMPFFRGYELLRDHLPDADRWKDKIQEIMRQRVMPPIDARQRITELSSANVGYGSNHLAAEIMGLTAYISVFENDSDFEKMNPGGEALRQKAQEWLERFMAYMKPGGYWPESDGPTIGYNALTASWLFRCAVDLKQLEKYRPQLEKAAAFHTYTLFANLKGNGVADGRNRSATAKRRLEICGLIPEGRFVLEQITDLLLEDSRCGETISPEVCCVTLQTLDLLPLACSESRNIWKEKSWCQNCGEHLISQKIGPWMSALQKIPFRPRPEGHWNYDYQNLFSLYHNRFGIVFLGNHGKNDPEMSTFNKAFTTFDGEPIEKPLLKYIPGEGRMTATDKGFSLWRDYRGFEGLIDLEILSDSSCLLALRANTRMEEYPITCSLQPAISLGRGFSDGGGKTYQVSEEPFSLSGAELGGSITLQPESRPNWISDAQSQAVTIRIPDDAQLCWPYKAWDPYNQKTDRHLKPVDWTVLLKIPVGPDGVDLLLEVG
jgi:hypothetical protein